MRHADAGIPSGSAVFHSVTCRVVVTAVGDEVFASRHAVDSFYALPSLLVVSLVRTSSHINSSVPAYFVDCDFALLKCASNDNTHSQSTQL